MFTHTAVLHPIALISSTPDGRFVAVSREPMLGDVPPTGIGTFGEDAELVKRHFDPIDGTVQLVRMGPQGAAQHRRDRSVRRAGPTGGTSPNAKSTCAYHHDAGRRGFGEQRPSSTRSRSSRAPRWH